MVSRHVRQSQELGMSHQILLKTRSPPSGSSSDTLFVGPDGQIIAAQSHDVMPIPAIVPESKDGPYTEEITPPLTRTREAAVSTASSSTQSAEASPSSLVSSAGSDSYSASTVSVSEATSTASYSPPSASPTHVTNVALASNHGSTFYVGIAFAAIAGVSFLLALLLWYLRIRGRSKTSDVFDRLDSWPFNNDDRHLEDGIHDTPQANTRYSDETTCDAKFRDHSELDIQFPPGILGKDHVLHGIPITSSHAPYTPYPTVYVHNAHQSVPDLAPDLGRLQVANYMPGDVLSSGDEASRATSRIGSTASECGTPLQMVTGEELARRLEEEGGQISNGFTWTPSALTPGHPQSDVKDLPLLPFPGQTRGTTCPSMAGAVHSQEGWAASIRSNLVNAFHAVVGGSNPSTPEDNLTPAPHRTRGKGGILSRKSTVLSGKLSIKSNSKASVVRIDSLHRGEDNKDEKGDWDDLSAYITSTLSMSGNGAETGIQRPPVARVKSRDRTSAGTLSRASSVYSAASNQLQRSDSIAPQLPMIPPMSRSSTAESQLQPPVQIKPRAGRKSLMQTRKARKTTRRTKPGVRRPTMKPRQESSASGLSLGYGSDMSMSRNSSTDSGPLTDQEKFAKMALRERRRRVAASRMRSVGAGRKSVKRLGSGRKGSVAAKALVRKAPMA